MVWYFIKHRDTFTFINTYVPPSRLTSYTYKLLGISNADSNISQLLIWYAAFVIYWTTHGGTMG